MRIFDLHCDTLTACLGKKLELLDSGRMVDLRFAGQAEDWVQCFAVFVPDRISGEDALQWVRDHGAYFDSQAGKYPEKLRTVRTAGDLAAPADGRCRGMLTIEGGRAFAGQLEAIDEFYGLGVRMVTLTWNGENELGFGAAENKGLKPFGKEAVRRMRQLGIAIDISHLADAGVEDVFALDDGPVVASHSNCRSVCGHRRNLTDGQIREIIRRGGVIGLNFFTEFLNDAPEKAGPEDVYRHLEHLLGLGGEKAAALGSDYDGAEIPPQFDHCEKLPELYDYLLKKNYSEALLDDVFYGNAARFFAGLLGFPQPAESVKD